VIDVDNAMPVDLASNREQNSRGLPNIMYVGN
jgi:hypothetical protein